MVPKHQLEEFVIAALKAKNGSAHHVQVAKFIWDNYEESIRNHGDSLYTWQYDTRWAAQRLRDKGIIKPDNETPRGIWALAEVS